MCLLDAKGTSLVLVSRIGHHTVPGETGYLRPSDDCSALLFHMQEAKAILFKPLTADSTEHFRLASERAHQTM